MTPPAVVWAARCRCGYLTIQLGDQATHIIPPDEPAAAGRICDAHSTDDRFKPPPDDYRIR